MKKNEKRLQNMREFTSDFLGKAVVITAMIIIFLLEIAGINIALEIHNYLLLSLFGYVVVTIAMCYTKKVFFKKLNGLLLKKPVFAEVVLYILAGITIIISRKSFIAFILTIIIAVMHVDFLKVIEVEE